MAEPTFRISMTLKVMRRSSPYESEQVLGTSITDENVPEGIEPAVHLRARVMEELDRHTLKTPFDRAAAPPVRTFLEQPEKAEE